MPVNMSFRALIVVASLLLVVPVYAAPKHIEKKSVVCVDIPAETVTVVSTFYGGPLSTSSPVPADAESTVIKPSPVVGEAFTPDTTVTALVLAVTSVETPVPASSSASSSSAAKALDSTVPAVTNNTSAGGYENSLYFTNWGIYGANFQPQQLPASQVTRVLYAFADIQGDGTVISSDPYADYQKHFPTDSWNDPTSDNDAYGCIKQIYILKKANRQMKVLLSIGGWTYSPKFAPIAATAAGRTTFADSALKLVTDWGFDGIDIDWEYPTNAQEASDFVLLLQACRQAFDNYAAQYAPGYHFLITVASPAGPTNYNAMDLLGMDPYVDNWNVMAYDYAGSWDSTSGHQANVFPNSANMITTKFNTEQAMNDYMAKGIAPAKILMGLPLYGRSFESTSGIGDAYSGVGIGTIQPGVWLYKDLPRAGATEMYDDIAMASYSYDPISEELISYDNIKSAVEKASYLKAKGCGGALFWEASGDANGTDSLVGTMATQLGTLSSSQNLLSYPNSVYGNIRNGMPGS